MDKKAVHGLNDVFIIGQWPISGCEGFIGKLLFPAEVSSIKKGFVKLQQETKNNAKAIVQNCEVQTFVF